MRRLSLQTATSDEWLFFASSRTVKYSYIGKQVRMADNTLRSWRRSGTTKRVWELAFDVIERSEKDMILLLVEQTENLLFKDELMSLAVEVQIDFSSVQFRDLQSDESLYGTTIRLLEV